MASLTGKEKFDLDKEVFSKLAIKENRKRFKIEKSIPLITPIHKKNFLKSTKFRLKQIAKALSL